ncbi:MAG: hypothetical protein AAFR52_15260 [Pseudomonadota bacterium]
MDDRSDASAWPAEYEKPDWSAWVKWDKARPVSEVIADRSSVPQEPGYYVFHTDPNGPSPDTVLYVGKTWDKGGLQSRMKSYLHDPGDGLPPKTHLGGQFVQDHYLREDAPENVFVSFAPFESQDRQFVLETENSMIQYYNARYNTVGMKADTSFDDVPIRKGRLP